MTYEVVSQRDHQNCQLAPGACACDDEHWVVKEIVGRAVFLENYDDVLEFCQKGFASGLRARGRNV